MDDLLKKLGDLPLPAGLAQIDDRVLSALEDYRSDARATSPLLSMAALFALGVGYVSGNLLPAPATAADNPLALAENALAPSTLLDLL